MPTLVLPLIDAKLMASALVPHTARDEWTPGLSTVAVGIHDGQFAYATDRYTCGRYDLTNVASQWPDERLLIPRDLLSAILTLGPRTLPARYVEYNAVIETYGEPLIGERAPSTRASLSIETKPVEESGEGEMHYFRVFSAPKTDLKYPPVGALFDRWIPGKPVRNPVILNPEYLARFTTYAHKVRREMRVTLPPRGAINGATSGVLVEVGARFKGILMPINPFKRHLESFGTDLAAENLAREQANPPSQDTDSPETPDGNGPSGI